MSFLKPKIYTPPAPVAPAPASAGSEEMEKAAALAEEATMKAKKKKGMGATIVAGALTDQATGKAAGTPTLLG